MERVRAERPGNEALRARCDDLLATLSTAESPPEPAPVPGGADAPVWQVPHQVSQLFRGRQPQLAAFAEGFRTTRAGAAAVQALTGLAGVGKTELAVQYAHRHRAEYAVVWWVRAEEAATLAATPRAATRTAKRWETATAAGVRRPFDETPYNADYMAQWSGSLES